MGVVRLFFLYAFLSLAVFGWYKNKGYQHSPWLSMVFFPPGKDTTSKTRVISWGCDLFPQKNSKTCKMFFATFAATRGATMWPCIQHRGIPYQSTPKNLPRPWQNPDVWPILPSGALMFESTYPTRNSHFCTWKKGRLIQNGNETVFRSINFQVRRAVSFREGSSNETWHHVP